MGNGIRFSFVAVYSRPCIYPHLEKGTEGGYGPAPLPIDAKYGKDIFRPSPDAGLHLLTSQSSHGYRDLQAFYPDPRVPFGQTPR